MKTNILFLCTGNSCRSQMAEAWCRALRGDEYQAFSAGTIAKGLNPNMLLVMREVGIDPAAAQVSKTLRSVLDAGVHLDVIVTVCQHAHDECPVLSDETTRVVHVGFPDPPEMESQAASAQAALDCYRQVRDQIRAFIVGLPHSLDASVRSA